MNQVPQKLSVKEKIGYSLGDLAANLVFQTLVTYRPIFTLIFMVLIQNMLQRLSLL